MSAIEERLSELKGILEECDHFINEFGDEVKQDVDELKRDYEQACAKVEKVKKDCEREYLEMEAKGRREGYSAQQFKNIKQVCYYDPIERAEDYRDKTYDNLLKVQKILSDYPMLRQSAIHDRPQILKEIQDLEKQKYGRVITTDRTDPSSGGKNILGIIFWIVAIFFIFKACSGG